MNYYKKGNDYVASDLQLDLELATKEEYNAWANAQSTKQALLQELDNLDLKCIRALRVIQAGTGTEEDSKRLADLENQAEQIRQQIKELN